MNNSDNKTNIKERVLSVEGMMIVSKLETGQRVADFACMEDVETEPFNGLFRVQGMRDGNIYMTEKLRHKRGRPLFREDNSSLSLGRNGRYYFIFSMPEQLVDELPAQLTRQAKAIAKKLLTRINQK